MLKTCWCLVVVASAACSGPVNAVPCEQDSNCDLTSGGRCVEATSGTQWCAYPDGECPAGLRFSDQSVGDGLAGDCVEQGSSVDAGIDMAPDAPNAEIAFTVIYGDMWWVAYDSVATGWFLVYANGNVEPDVGTLQVVSVTDTHPVADFRVTAAPGVGIVSHEKVAGSTAGDGSALFAAAITEPRERTSEGYLHMQVLDAPFEEFDYKAHIELKLNGIQFPLDLDIHHPNSGITYHQPYVVLRKTIYKPL